MMTTWRRPWRKGGEIYYFDSAQAMDTAVCARMLGEMIWQISREEGKSGVLVLCIGTDRSTGDSLGPLTGYKLRESRMQRIQIMGTLERPVHAMNLDRSMELVRLKYPNHVVVAVDASVGNQDHVGCITLGRGSWRPGLGVSRDWEAVGVIFITGMGAAYSSRDPLMLQSVRLSVVMKMADYISRSVFLVEQFLEHAALV